MLCTLISRLLGFVRIAVMAALFGAGSVADAFNFVFNIPNNFRKLMAEGALSSAFIPVLSQSMLGEAGGLEKAKRLTQNIITFQLLVLIPLLSVAVIFAKPIIRALSEFTEPAAINLSVDLFRYVVFYLLFISVASIFMAVLNSLNIFMPSALTPIFFSVCVIGSLIFLYPVFPPGYQIYAGVVGVLCGGVVQVLFQFPFFKKKGFSAKLLLDFRNPDFRRVLVLWLPVLVSSSIFTINQLISQKFASGLEEGSVVALSYAIVFWQLPYGMFLVSIQTVMFPRMSRQAARGDNTGMRETLIYGLRFLLIPLVPATLYFMLQGTQAIEIALQRNNWSYNDTLITAGVLKYYALGLFSVSAYNYVQRFFYAVKDFKFPIYTAVVVTLLDVVLSLWLKSTPLRVQGLALAYTLSFSVGFLILLVKARQHLGGINLKKLFLTFFRVGVSTGAAVGVFWIYRLLLLTGWAGYSFLEKILFFVGGFTLFIGVCLVFFIITRVEIVSDIMRGRFKK